MQINESEIVDGLLSRDEDVTRQFFFGNGDKSCKPLLKSIVNYVFSYPVDYDEAVSEFYSYIMADDGYKLRQIQDRNTLFGWIKVCATRFFINRRDNLIDNMSKTPLFHKVDDDSSEDERNKRDAASDMRRILSRMKNKRYAYVLQMLIIQDVEPQDLASEMGITTANLYNIKKRAIAEFTKIALKDVILYEGH